MINYTDNKPWSSFKEKVISLLISDGVSSIGNHSFDNLSINSLVLPQSVSYIGGYSFIDNKDLVDIEIKGDINYIGDMAFSNCKKLKTLKYYSSVVPNCGTDVFLNSDIEDISVSESYSSSTFCGIDVNLSKKENDLKVVTIVVSVLLSTIIIVVLCVSIVLIVVLIIKKRKFNLFDVTANGGQKVYTVEADTRIEGEEKIQNPNDVDSLSEN